ncbi:MAG: hypothetical protein OEY78_10265 [Gammaproteobacteria bacterium]|nr:hypothetical protein [Gammaproteobacteria bacterium]
MKNIKLIPGIMVIFSFMLGSTYAETPRPGSPVIPLGTNANLPTHYPSYMLPSGKITKTIRQSRTIVVDGTAFKLHPVHEIFTKKKGQQATIYELRPGMKVGLEFTNYKGEKVAHKVWILPKDYPTVKYAH